MIGPLALVARRNAKTTFVLLDRSRCDVPHAPRNVIGITFREEEGSYAAGYLAVEFLELHRGDRPEALRRRGRVDIAERRARRDDRAHPRRRDRVRLP